MSRYDDHMAKRVSNDGLTTVFQALSNPTRLAILKWLREPASFPPQDQPAEDVGVCLKHIQARAGISQSTASQYMAILQRADLVTSQRIGHWTHYKRNQTRLAQLANHIAADL